MKSNLKQVSAIRVKVLKSSSRLSKKILARRGLEALANALHKEHEKLFTFRLELPVELVNLRVTVSRVKPANVSAGKITKGDGKPDKVSMLRTTTVWMDGCEQDATIYDRAKLKAGDKIKGPAIITEMDSTTLVSVWRTSPT